MKRNLTVAATLALLTMGGGAWAQSNEDRITAGIIANELRDLGYSAKIDADDSGDPRVNTAVDGHKWQVYFYDCSDGELEERRCDSFQFFADNSMRSPVPAALINKWNKEYRYAKAYLQQGNEPGCPAQRSCAARIEIDVLTAGTGADPARTFRAYFEVMRRRAAGFRKYINAPE
jgi:hypothetical protein